MVRAAQRIDQETGAYCKSDKHSEWVRKLSERVGINKASVAVANKNARMIVSILKTGIEYKAELAHA